MGKLRVYWLKTLKKLSIYPLGNTPSAPSDCHVNGELIPTDLSLGKVAESARLVEDDGAQGTGVLHSQFQSRIGLFFTCVMTNDATTEGGALVGIEVVTGQLASGHLADSVNKITTVKVFKPVLIRVVGIRMMIEVHGQRVHDPVLVASVLRNIQYCQDMIFLSFYFDQFYAPSLNTYPFTSPMFPL